MNFRGELEAVERTIRGCGSTLLYLMIVKWIILRLEKKVSVCREWTKVVRFWKYEHVRSGIIIEINYVNAVVLVGSR